MKELLFDTGKVLINYVETPVVGPAADHPPALVLLHGGSGRWQLLERLIQDLTQHWHVYATDLRGHGRSGRVPWRYTLLDYARDIGAFLQQVSGPAFLFGHSLGGIVALMTAGFHPEYVRAVLVGDSPLDASAWKMMMQGGQREMVQYWRQLSGGSYSVQDIQAKLKDAPLSSNQATSKPPLRMSNVYPDGHAVYLDLAERLYLHDPDVLGMLLDDFDNASAGFEMEKLFPVIHCPVLLMQADPKAGGAMTDGEVNRALLLLAHPAVVRFHGLSHLFYMEDPQNVLKVIEGFLYQNC